jgi:hypothetical protein
MINPTSTSPALETPRKRLFRKYRQLKAWRKVARELSDKAGIEINVRYPYELAVKGIVPANKQIQRALGIPRPHHTRTIDEHLAQDGIQDMPAPLLAWAFENRQVME